MEGNSLAYVVIRNIIVASAVTAVLIVLVILQDFLLHGRSSGFNINSDIANHLEQRGVVCTAFAYIVSGIDNQIVAAWQIGSTNSQCRSSAGFIGMGQLGKRIGKSAIRIIIGQYFCHGGSVRAGAKEAAIGGISLQCSKESIAVNAAAPYNILQSAFRFIASEYLVCCEAVSAQNTIAGNGNCRRQSVRQHSHDHHGDEQESQELFC